MDHEEIKFGNKAYLALVIIDGASNLPVGFGSHKPGSI